MIYYIDDQHVHFLYRPDYYVARSTPKRFFQMIYCIDDQHVHFFFISVNMGAREK
jgi:hypothetical protein